MEKILPWFMLKNVPGLGNILIKRLVTHFGSPARVLGAPVEALTRVSGISRHTAENISRCGVSDSIKRELELLQGHKCRFIPFTAPDYPALLKEIPDPPPYLYAYGDPGPTHRGISVVGSRRATPYGIAITQQLCREFAASGFIVVSGLARGIDTAAHKGALAGGGKTLAVLGSGLLHIYPGENKRLARQIAENGAVITEFPLNAEPEPHHFPARNRIISGISLGTIVVEAAGKSGSLITARMALEQNREVFAVPGSIRSGTSDGTNGLIKQGAKLIDSAKDVMEELVPMISGPPGVSLSSPRMNGLSPDERRVMEALGTAPLHMDELVRKLSFPAGELSGLLLKLELQGLVRQSTGNYFYCAAS